MRTTIGTIVLGLVWLSAAVPARATELWAFAFEPPWRAVKGWQPNDYMDLFARGAPWGKVRSALSVLSLNLRFVLLSSDADLSTTITALRQQGIKLAIAAAPLTRSRECGTAIESFGPPGEMEAAAARLKRFGAELRYIWLDEPLYFGHRFPGRGSAVACRYPIDRVASESARKLAPLFAIYPDVVVGDVEPIGGGLSDAVAWAGEILHWHAAFATATGRKISFFDADITWYIENSVPSFLQALPVLRREGIPIGVMYDGPGAASSDQEWVGHMLANVETLEVAEKFIPNHAFIVSWTERPRVILPETLPGTFTNGLLRYIDGRESRGLPIRRP